MKTFGELLKEANTPKKEEVQVEASEESLLNPMSIGHYIDLGTLPIEDFDSLVEEAFNNLYKPGAKK